MLCGACLVVLFFSSQSEAEREAWVKAYSWLLKDKSIVVSEGVSNPFNVKHISHVNTDFEWSNVNLEEGHYFIVNLSLL